MSLKELLKEMDDEVAQEEALLFNTKPLTVNHNSILEILNELPILVQPTLNWLQTQKRRLSAAQLTALYSTEELKQMYSEEEWKNFKQMYNVKE